MNAIPVAPMPRPAPRTLAARVGDALRRHRRAILALQWLVVVFYGVLVVVPAMLPLPPAGATFVTNLTLFAQFAFWGIWWPFVIASTMLVGRAWCGLLCPEGTLTEFASRHGLGKSIPRWMRWSGWPFVAFAVTTVYGQLVSVYEYPKAVLLVLGGSTVAAVAIGFVYGKGKRVWCRYLCPVNGVFELLAKVAPLHFGVDADAWRRSPARVPSVDCAPLVDLRHMRSASQCHACGRCSGHRDAIALAPRSPNREILALRPNDVGSATSLLLVFGVLGLATGAFQWTASPWFVATKQALAQWLVERGSLALLDDRAPWWLLTHYPEVNDVFTWLDGALVVAYIASVAIVLSAAIFAALYAAALAVPGPRPRSVWRLAHALIPLAGLGVFLGLSNLTVSLARAEGMWLAWVAWMRATLLAAGASWSAYLFWRMLATAGATPRRLAAWLACCAAIGVVVAAWAVLFLVWAPVK